MNIAPNTTTSPAAASNGNPSASSNNNIKRWTMASAAASCLHFTRPSSGSPPPPPPPPPPPCLAQHFHNNIVNVDKTSRHQGGHKSRHHHVGSSKALSSLSNKNSTACRSSWKEGDFAIDVLLGEGHFGKVYRAHCYSRSFMTSSGNDIGSSGNNNNGLPRKLGITVASTSFDASSTSTATNNNSTTPNTVALKRFSKCRIADAQERGSRLVELLQREINIHSNLQHPFIISFLGHYVDQHHLTLVLEYAAFGDLYGYMAMSELQQQPDGMSLSKRIEMARTVMSQMTAAVAHLQQLYVAHRDIKSENVLLVEIAPPSSSPSTASTSGPRRAMPVPTVFKLCDFGWAVSYQGFISGRLSTLCGTPEYVPPEMLGPNRFYRGEFVDPWALGVLAYELVVGDTPFYVDDHENETCGRGAGSGGSSQVQQGEATMATSNTTLTDGTSSSSRKKNTVDRIFDNIRNFREVQFPFADADEDYIDLVQGFLQVEPMHRRLAGDCMNHAFFQNALSNRGTASSAGQKENMQNHSDSRTAAPTVSQRCEIWNKQKQFGHWPGSEHEI